MDADRDLLFGVVALRTGTVNADHLAETCARWAAAPTVPLAELLVDGGLLTVEKRSELEKVVAHELEAHAGDPQATLAANLDAPALETLRRIALPGGHSALGSSPPADERGDRYTLSRLHRSGGMGRIWLAVDKALGRVIALKELRPDHAADKVRSQRFLREAKIAAQLEHPGIVPVYELSQGAAPYYTMRFVRGRTLSEAIKDYHAKRAAGDDDPVMKIALLSAFVSVCHAMAYAHARGIIHRDLKGQNIALGEYGEVMVLDWGLAKRIRPDGAETSSAPIGALAAGPTVADATAAEPGLSSTVLSSGAGDAHGDTAITEPDEGADRRLLTSTALSNGGADPAATSIANSLLTTVPAQLGSPEATRAGQVLGTPAYMAPEQAMPRHDLVDERTDVYGLGAILYEILTGRPPFLARSTAEIIRKICHDAPTPPHRIKRGIDRRLEAICLQALRKQPDERYATASALGHDVQRYLADLPIEACAESWSSRALRWARRHKTVVVSAGALLVATSIVAALGYALVSAERNEAAAQGQQARHAVSMLTRVADIGFDDELNPLQKEFLEEALGYYNQFTGRVAGLPDVRLEHGKVYQQMGDILRKLGRLSDSESAYRKSLAILEPLADLSRADKESRRALARTRALLAELLIRSGRDESQAEPLLRQARAAWEILAAAPAAANEDRLRLGQTLKIEGDWLRLSRQFTTAKPVYDRGILMLEQVRAANPKHVECRIDLALTIDARGWIHRELGEVAQAEQDFSQALALLDTLLAESPTGSRYRESVARVCNSLALIERDAGRLSEAEAHLRRELPLVERLSQDFPERPEYVRQLARSWMNLGNVLSDQGRLEEAEPALSRAVELNSTIVGSNPRDVQIELDLSRCQNCLGELTRQIGQIPRALQSLASARAIGEKLVSEFPRQPRYREDLATTLSNLALAQEAVDPAKAEQIYQSALSLFEALVNGYPDNVEYRLGLARCLRNFGPLIASAHRDDEAQAVYHKALAALQTNDSAALQPAARRERGILLNNLGELQLSLKRPEAEKTLREAIDTFDRLASRESASQGDRHYLAIAQANLGELLVGLKRLDEATSQLNKATAGFDKLATEQPRSIEIQSHFGMVRAVQSRCLATLGNSEEAKRALENAIAHQREAVELSQNRPAYRSLLAGHMRALARIDLDLGAREDAAKIALKLPGIVPAPDRTQACFDCARILVRVVDQLRHDARLTPADRTRIARGHAGRIALFLREAIDSDPKLAEAIKADTEINELAARPEFRDIMSSLTKLGR
jgi:serine/threonine protein kinase